MFFSLRLLFVKTFLFAFSYKAFAVPVTFDKTNFKLGSSWTWAYSERDEVTKTWSDPYLFETYEVVELSQDKVTIEMSSSSYIDKKEKAHHKFVADLDSCLKKGEKTKNLKKFKIQFFTKTLGKNWQLLSKHHKGLAFTEKFNCLSAQHDYRERESLVDGVPMVLFRWLNLPIHSWYSAANGHLSGVMMIRKTKNYLVELVTSS